MTDEIFLELKKSGIYKKESDMLLKLNDIFMKYVYLRSIENIETEKQNLFSQIQLNYDKLYFKNT